MSLIEKCVMAGRAFSDLGEEVYSMSHVLEFNGPVSKTVCQILVSNAFFDREFAQCEIQETVCDMGTFKYAKRDGVRFVTIEGGAHE